MRENKINLFELVIELPGSFCDNEDKNSIHKRGGIKRENKRNLFAIMIELAERILRSFK